MVALGAECGTVGTIDSGPVGRITVDLALLTLTCSSAGQLCLYQNVVVATNVDRLCCKSMLSLNLCICRSAPHMIKCLKNFQYKLAKERFPTLTYPRPNTFSHQHASAMHWATWGGHTEIVKLLLEHKVAFHPNMHRLALRLVSLAFAQVDMRLPRC